MKKIAIAFSLCIATAAMYSCNDQPKDTVEVAKEANESKDSSNTLAVSEDDSKFLVFGADAGMTEVEAAKVAQGKTTNQKVKDFAADMIKDHTAAGNDLKSLASSKNVSVPVDISKEHQDAIADLGKKTGADFDKAYIDMMVDDHQKVVDKFKDASDNAKDPDIKAFATKTLPTLQAHLEHAKMLKDGMK